MCKSCVGHTVKRIMSFNLVAALSPVFFSVKRALIEEFLLKMYVHEIKFPIFQKPKMYVFINVGPTFF